MKRRIQLTKFRQQTGIKVGDIMTRQLVVANPDSSVKECVKNSLKTKADTILVTKDGHLIGLVRRREVLNLMIQDKDPSKVKIIEIMKRNIKTITPDKDLYEATSIMKKNKVKRLPVVEDGKVIGILTLDDIIKFEPKLIEQIMEAFHIREETEKLRRLSKHRDHRILHGIEPKGNVEGPCEECGNYGWLEETEGRLICVECKDVYGF